MGAGADRVGEPGQIGLEPLGERFGQRRQRSRPAAVVPLGLGMKRQQPGPAIRPLEAARISSVQIVELAPHLLRRSIASPAPRRVARRTPRKQPPIPPAAQYPCTQLSIRAAEEDRVSSRGPTRPSGPSITYRLVRKFLRQVPQCIARRVAVSAVRRASFSLQSLYPLRHPELVSGSISPPAAKLEDGFETVQHDMLVESQEIDPRMFRSARDRGPTAP